MRVAKIIQLLVQRFVKQMLSHPPRVVKHLAVKKYRATYAKVGTRCLLPIEEDDHMRVTERAPRAQGEKRAEQCGPLREQGQVREARRTDALAREIVVKNAPEDMAEDVVALRLTPDPRMPWLRPQPTDIGGPRLQRSARPTFRQMANGFPKYFLARFQWHSVMCPLHDLTQGLLDGVAYDGVANDTILTMRSGALESTRKICGDG